MRGGLKAARNSAIGCACLLAVIEGVGIGFQRMMAENTKLDVRTTSLLFYHAVTDLASLDSTTTSTTGIRRKRTSFGVSLFVSTPSSYYLFVSNEPPLLYSFFPCQQWRGLCIFQHWQRSDGLFCMCIIGTVYFRLFRRRLSQ